MVTFVSALITSSFITAGLYLNYKIFSDFKKGDDVNEEECDCSSNPK